jgi:hypothetical protein
MLLAGADEAVPLLVVLAAFTLVALVLSLAWRPLLVLVLIGLAVELVVRLLDEHVSRGEAVALGTGALVLCELIAWADSLRGPALVAPGVVGRRVLNLLLAAVVGAAAAALAVSAGSVEAPNAFVAGVAGAAAVAAIAAVVWSLGRRAA